MPIPRERSRDVPWDALAPVAVAVLALLLRLPGPAAEDLWFDEVYSVVLASQDLGELLRRALGDQTNPPGFYVLLSGWIGLGDVSATWLRALPALAGALTAPAVLLLGRSLGMPRGPALVAGLLAATSPLLLAMSAEVRAYAPLALVTSATLALGARVALAGRPPRPRDVAGLAAAELALVSLHYFGALVIASRLIATGWTRRARWRPALLAALPAVVALGVWGALVVAGASGQRLAGNASWITPPGFGAVAGFASVVIGTFEAAWGRGAVATALAAAIVVAAVRARRPSMRGTSTATAEPTAPSGVTGEAWSRARWLLVAALLPLILIFTLSITSRQSLWVGRYLIVALPPLWLLAADAAFALRGMGRTIAVATLATWALLAGPLAERSRAHKPAWSRIVRALAGGAAGRAAGDAAARAANVRPVTVCVNEPFVGLPLQYYAIREAVALAVIDYRVCAAERVGDYALLRPETAISLTELARAGATVGPARALHTELPDTELRPLHWPAASRER